MSLAARYAHTNLVARDWGVLARFYQQVFGCKPLSERDLSGDWVEALTGLPGARLRGIHLRLPGHGAAGPTLEIFQYDPAAAPLPSQINRPGLAHLAFEVEDVSAARDAVIEAGGGDYGAVVTAGIPAVGRIEVAYVTDPEGNILELQRWLR